MTHHVPHFAVGVRWVAPITIATCLAAIAVIAEVTNSCPVALDTFYGVAAASLADVLLDFELLTTFAKAGFIAGLSEGTLIPIFADGARGHHWIDAIRALKAI
jgi:hypothetical protein